MFELSFIRFSHFFRVRDYDTFGVGRKYDRDCVSGRKGWVLDFLREISGPWVGPLWPYMTPSGSFMSPAPRTDGPYPTTHGPEILRTTYEHSFSRNTVSIVCQSFSGSSMITHPAKMGKSDDSPFKNAVVSVPHLIDCIFHVFCWITKLFGTRRDY